MCADFCQHLVTEKGSQEL